MVVIHRHKIIFKMCKLTSSHNGYCGKCEIPCSVVIPSALKLISVELFQQLRLTFSGYIFFSQFYIIFFFSMYSPNENNVAYTVCDCDNFETLARVKSWVPGRCLTKENCFCPPSIHFTSNTHNTILGAICSVCVMQ
jgi:hypothetical protein